MTSRVLQCSVRQDLVLKENCIAKSSLISFSLPESDSTHSSLAWYRELWVLCAPRSGCRGSERYAFKGLNTIDLRFLQLCSEVCRNVYASHFVFQTVRPPWINKPSLGNSNTYFGSCTKSLVQAQEVVCEPTHIITPATIAGLQLQIFRLAAHTSIT